MKESPVKILMENQMLSCRELAKISGCGLAQIVKARHGLFERLHVRTVRKLATALGVDPGELLAGCVDKSLSSEL